MPKDIEKERKRERKAGKEKEVAETRSAAAVEYN
jgi:hypothetical protein